MLLIAGQCSFGRFGQFGLTFGKYDVTGEKKAMIPVSCEKRAVKIVIKIEGLHLG